MNENAAKEKQKRKVVLPPLTPEERIALDEAVERSIANIENNQREHRKNRKVIKEWVPSGGLDNASMGEDDRQ